LPAAAPPCLLVAVTWLFLKGVGIWAITQPVAWGFAIINFVWWIGIGHAGTLISAILLLFKQGWRNSISRFAEAMTIFAVVCAGMFPLIHVGRPWLALLAASRSQHDDRLAAVPLAAALGRVRGVDLRHYLGGDSGTWA
jgi:Ni/Fe-hydrogenase subunit HybB-like protein